MLPTPPSTYCALAALQNTTNLNSRTPAPTTKSQSPYTGIGESVTCFGQGRAVWHKPANSHPT